MENPIYFHHMKNRFQVTITGSVQFLCSIFIAQVPAKKPPGGGSLMFCSVFWFGFSKDRFGFYFGFSGDLETLVFLDFGWFFFGFGFRYPLTRSKMGRNHSL